MISDSDNEVATLIVRHRIKAGHEQQYEIWLRRIIDTASRYAGHMGVNVVRSRSNGLPLFTCVLHFSCTTYLQGWLDSSDRQELIGEVKPMLADGDKIEVLNTREFWFTPTSEHNPPPRWKQAILTFSVIMPLTLVIPQFFQPVFERVTWLETHPISAIITTLSIVLLVVYVFMPLLTRWLAPWLNPRIGNE
jgi:antibiotic biosynthesis monooxygenase (ABM) superfamily enzyme